MIKKTCQNRSVAAAHTKDRETEDPGFEYEGNIHAPAGASSGGSPGHALPGGSSGGVLSVELGGVLSLEIVRSLSVAALSLKVLSLEVLSLESARTRG